MFETILVPLDGSPLAAAAVPYAEFLARKSGGKIELVRALELWGATPGSVIEKELELKPQAEKELEAAAAEVTARGVPAVGHVYVGEATSVLHTAIGTLRAGLVVMSTHGRSGPARWAYGSVAERVLRSSPVPVVLISSHLAAGWDWNSPGPILLPLDGSPLAEQTLEPAIQLAKLLGVGMNLLQVIEPPNPGIYAAVPGAVFPELDLQSWVEEAKPYLRDVAGRVRGLGVANVATETIIGYAAPAIMAAAQANKASTIAMATHGRTGIARMVLGSVAAGVIQRTDRPMLIVKARPAEPQQA